MKPSSGRATGVANRAGTRAAGGVATRVASIVASAFATASFGLAASFLAVAPAHAQVSTATADGTPQIDAAIAQKDWTSALAQLDARLATNPRDVQAKFKRATVLARLNRDKEAIAAFTELTQAYPELPEPYNNLAALYAKEGRYEDARVALEMATKANPGYALAYDNLGDLYLRLAGESYKRAQSLGSTSPLTRQRVADIQKIITPPPKKRAAPTGASAAAAASAASAPAGNAQNAPSSDERAPAQEGTQSPSDMQVPGSPFGGPTGPMPTSPYIAPNSRP